MNRPMATTGDRSVGSGLPATRGRIAVLLMTSFPAAALLGLAAFGLAAEVHNFTGLPAYPNLSTAKMDTVSRTDKLGRWCSRFAGGTFDSLDAVEAWYRKTLIGASETDLNNDERYASVPGLVGIKLVVGIDYVAIYRAVNQSATSIELFKCSPP